MIVMLLLFAILVSLLTSLVLANKENFVCEECGCLNYDHKNNCGECHVKK